MSDHFPSSIDREVASSLLLLSSGPCFFSSSIDSYGSEGKFISVQGNFSLSLASTGTRSCDSALSNNGSSRQSPEAAFMNFKIAKKRRTNVIWSSVDLKPRHSKNPEFDDLSECLSNGSSEISRIERRIKTITREKPHRSSSIRCKAVKILEFLLTSSSSEVKIRQVLGDSADTSKALRMLLKKGDVKRSGAGGKHDPFVYKIA